MISSAYIHIPFCSHKCDFCDFAAYANLDYLAEDYMNVVCREIEDRLCDQSSRPKLSSVFYGGGTPGWIDPRLVEQMHSKLLSKVSLCPDAEINLETTPHAITRAKAKAWLEMGINRLSIGVESFQDSELSLIGRDHSVKEAVKGIAIAAKAGFQNINLDLMYGLPSQTVESFSSSLEQLALLARKYKQIKHVSSYALHLSDRSPLLSKFPLNSSVYADDDQFIDMYEILVQMLAAMGFSQYEVSNFSRPGFQSIHNLNYWGNGEYLAFGVGAHRYVQGVRSANWGSLKQYMVDPLGLQSEEPIDDSTRLKEAIMLGLRLRDGIDLARFEEDHGVNLLRQYAGKIKKLEGGALIEFQEGKLRLTSKAVPVSNLVIAEFF